MTASKHMDHHSIRKDLDRMHPTKIPRCHLHHLHCHATRVEAFDLLCRRLHLLPTEISRLDELQ